VPLRTSGFGVGIVACHDGPGGIVAYIMGTRFERVPLLEALADLTADDAVRVMRLGDLGLVKASWRVIGRTPRWSPAVWPVPAFARRDISGLCYRVEYERNDLRQPTREVEITEAECRALPRDALSGSGAVERVLTALLDAGS
jgi:hypothetical protein